MDTELALWVALFAIVGSMLALDLLVLNRDAKPVPFRRAAAWSATWISLALGFGAVVALTRGGEVGGEYLAGYLIELSLSVDNVFVFALIFAAFAVPAAYQHRLLFWGILGAVVFRAIFITAGVAVLAAAHWVIYLLGLFLVVTGVRLARSQGHTVDPKRSRVLRLFRRLVPMTDDYEGPAFIVREGGRRVATPLLAVLVVIEATDIMFAVDSIPAVFAVTTDPFIVFSSNLFAILGLRSLYFLLAGLLQRFVYLNLGLAAVLVLAGLKILVSDLIHVPIAVSLGAIVFVLGTAIAASIVATHPRRDALQAAVVRIAAGAGLGLAGVALFVVAAALRDGATWLAPLATAVLAVGAVVLVGSGAAAVRAGHGRSSWAAIRIGSGVLLGLAGAGVMAGMTGLRDPVNRILALEMAALVAAVAVVVGGFTALRRARANSAMTRGWALAGGALLLVLMSLILLE